MVCINKYDALKQPVCFVRNCQFRVGEGTFRMLVHDKKKLYALRRSRTKDLRHPGETEGRGERKGLGHPGEIEGRAVRE